jgi:xanthine dehydrogenase molybdopterin-binding subunit B
VIVRSSHAHANIASVNKAAALASPGVLAVLTGHDYVTDGLEPIPHGAGLMGRPDVPVRVRGFDRITTRDYPMPHDKVRFVGEPVAMVVAETVDQAKDAAELLYTSYEPLPAVVRAADAVQPRGAGGDLSITRQPRAGDHALGVEAHRHHPVAGLEAGHSRPDLDDLAGSIAASRPFGGCGFARLKAQVVERPELGPIRRRAVNLNRRKAVPPMEIGGITAFHAAGAA